MSKRRTRRIPPRPKIQFTCMVDEELMLQANKLRTRTWPDTTEQMLQHIVDGMMEWHNTEKLVRKS